VEFGNADGSVYRPRANEFYTNALLWRQLFWYWYARRGGKVARL